MVPSVWMELEALPLTPNGKVDRSALPAPGELQPQPGTPYVAPRGELEEALAEIWSDLLEVDAIGVHDSFFDLGGHSLKAVQLLSRVRDTFDVELPAKDFFVAPSIANLAAAVAQEIAKGVDQALLASLLEELEQAGSTGDGPTREDLVQ
jgi:acyl carrier protein